MLWRFFYRDTSQQDSFLARHLSTGKDMNAWTAHISSPQSSNPGEHLRPPENFQNVSTRTLGNQNTYPDRFVLSNLGQ